MADDPNRIISHRIGRVEFFAEAAATAEAADAGSYWTEERIAAATPIEPEAEASDDSGAGPEVVWRGRRIRRGEAAAEESAPEALEALQAADFQTARVNDRNAAPYAAIGKLLMTIRGVDKFGSAWAVGPRAVITAGHCVYPETVVDWVSNLAFAPRYHRRPSSGVWNATSIHALGGWIDQGNNAWAFDLAGTVLDRALEPATGAIGWLANANPDMGEFQSVGYPERWLSNQYDFDGQEMWRCTGSQLAQGAILKMANNMTKGISGGPWLVQRNGRIYANGVNSFRSSDQPEVVSSPYFGTGFLNLLRALDRAEQEG